MLGRFLEYSLPTPDIQASFNFYRKLGFSEAAVGDTWGHPYAVLTDGRLCLGLHQVEAEPVFTFVRPQLLQHLDALEAAGVEFDYRRLGNDVFNEVGWTDPSGHRLRMLEARTFSPSKRSDGEYSALGYFREIVLPAADLDLMKDYYEKLGFVGMEEFEERVPHVSCTSDTIDIGLYEAHLWRGPTLCFETDNVKAGAAQLAALGIESSKMLSAALRSAGVAVYTAPEGTAIWLLPAT